MQVLSSEAENRLGMMNSMMTKMRNARIAMDVNQRPSSQNGPPLRRENDFFAGKNKEKVTKSVVEALPGFHQMITKKKTVFFSGETEQELGKYI